MKFLDSALIGACAVIWSNTVCKGVLMLGFLKIPLKTSTTDKSLIFFFFRKMRVDINPLPSRQFT